MAKVTETNPQQRLNYSDDLAPVIERTCRVYGIGKIESFNLIETGYEDCNVLIKTSNRKFLAKMFAKYRKEEDIERFVAIVLAALDAGVNHPKILKTNTGYIYRDETDIVLALLEFVEGKTFKELGRVANDNERQSLLEQAAFINRIGLQPSFMIDTWAIQHLEPVYADLQSFMTNEDKKMVEEVVREYRNIHLEALPQAFVHGDLTKANVIKSDDGKIYVIDFSVSNWYPRIQELAVIAANFLNDPNSDMSLKEKTVNIATEYSKFNRLTEEELKYLYPVTLAAVAMELLGGLREVYLKKQDSEETQYWISLGRNGLRKALN